MGKAEGHESDPDQVEQGHAERRLSPEQKQALGRLRARGRGVVAGAVRQVWHDGEEAQPPEHVFCEKITALVRAGNRAARSSRMAWAGMTNRAMQRKLYAGRAVDLSRRERTEDGSYRLETFRRGIDYCNAETETWICSIGRHRETGLVLASHTCMYHRHPTFDCLFVRKSVR